MSEFDHKPLKDAEREAFVSSIEDDCDIRSWVGGEVRSICEELEVALDRIAAQDVEIERLKGLLDEATGALARIIDVDDLQRIANGEHVYLEDYHGLDREDAHLILDVLGYSPYHFGMLACDEELPEIADWVDGE